MLSLTMVVGIVIMLVASASCNAAPIVLRVATRALPDHTGVTLLRAVLTRRTGLAGLTLSLLGWSLEIVALTLIPLTLGRVLFAAGLGLLLALAHRTLHEPVGRREVIGVLAVIGGMAAVATAPPAHTTTLPSLAQWLLLVVPLGAVLLAPFILRLARRHAGALLSAVAAGSAYALASLFNKGLSNVLLHLQLLPLLLLLAGAAASALLGFVSELEALRGNHAARVAPVYRTLQTLLPIACAPLFFDERWPTNPLALFVLAGGIAITVLGILIISWPRADERTLPAPRVAWDWAAFLRRHRTCVVVELVLLGLALGLDVLVKLHPAPLPGDVETVLAWQHLMRPHKLLTLLVYQVSELTWPIPALITTGAVVGLLLLLRRWLDALVVMAFTGLGSAAFFLTAMLVQRPRPLGHGLYIYMYITNYASFPSGHVEHVVVLCGLLIFLTYQQRRGGPWLWLLRLFLVAYIALIGPSRMLEGEHWLSDSVAGYLYGAFWLMLGIHAYGLAAAHWPRLLARSERKRVAYAT